MGPPSPERPGPHPQPPADFPHRQLPIARIASSWSRIYRCRHNPVHFGRDRLNRFDDPEEEFGVLYVAGDEYCAFAETFGQSTGINTVTVSALSERCLCRITARQPLALVDLTGEGLLRIGADDRLCTGDHAVAQHWSRALWSHPDCPDGILYRSRHDPSGACAAIFDRVATLIRADSEGGMLDPARRQLLADIMDTYGFGLI